MRKLKDNDGRAHPRSRGEHPSNFLRSLVRPGSSPLTRGAHAWGDTINREARLIPAHAGSTTQSAGKHVLDTAHPRSRGEHDRVGALESGGSGSSPLTRGAPLRCPVLPATGRLIPAHAGSTCMGWRGCGAHGAHPRSRGEHAASSSAGAASAGSSPLTRGARFGQGDFVSHVGLIPAHAGSTEDVDIAAYRTRAHPRSRGEHTC